MACSHDNALGDVYSYFEMNISGRRYPQDQLPILRRFSPREIVGAIARFMILDNYGSKSEKSYLIECDPFRDGSVKDIASMMSGVIKFTSGDEKKSRSLTLSEALLWGLVHFVRDGHFPHIDVQIIPLSTRFHNGTIPSVLFRECGLEILYFEEDTRFDGSLRVPFVIPKVIEVY